MLVVGCGLWVVVGCGLWVVVVVVVVVAAAVVAAVAVAASAAAAGAVGVDCSLRHAQARCRTAGCCPSAGWPSTTGGSAR